MLLLSSMPAQTRAQGGQSPQSPPSQQPTPDLSHPDDAAQPTSNKQNQSSEAPGKPEDEEKRPENGYWSQGKPRLFVSSRSEAGGLYIKPYLSAGYGLPHWIWVGFDLNSIITTSLEQIDVGVRASTPLVDLSFMWRDTYSFDKAFLPAEDSFTRNSVLHAPGSNARYMALEGEAVGIVPLPHAALVADFVMVDILDLPKGQYVYEENYRAITKNPLFFVMRMAALARFLPENCLKVGGLAEYVFGTGRAEGVWRVGPIGQIQLTDHLSLNAGFTLMVSSPDHLGLALGAYGVAGLKYLWASGEKKPELPWQGHWIPW